MVLIKTLYRIHESLGLAEIFAAAHMTAPGNKVPDRMPRFLPGSCFPKARIVGASITKRGQGL